MPNCPNSSWEDNLYIQSDVMSQTADVTAEKKRTLRSCMRGLRVDCPGLSPRAAERAAEVFLAHVPLSAHAVVAGYWAQDREINPLPLLEILASRGHTIVFPALVAKDQPLVFRAWKKGDALAPGRHQILEPLPDAPALDPDVLLVPLLAFDRFGARLGYGGGYYDRTLKDLRARKRIWAIGFAYALQETRLVPTSDGDQRVDAVVTEKGMACQRCDFRALLS